MKEDVVFPSDFVGYAFSVTIDGKVRYVLGCPHCGAVQFDVGHNVVAECGCCHTQFCHDGLTVMDLSHPDEDDEDMDGQEKEDQS